ncbi:hypothetical protein TCAL_10274 [Tigriopus californicus]|uniref:Motile sperm domain-containing protein 2 n=1 Tax=Tigriopus californicus TaxID=6832 RepID=A0A553N830_TIGCA|nr:hypothetical protein TCAL_10274 [Tigriopus californicus]
MGEGDDPTPEQIQSIRSDLQMKIEEIGSGDFDPRDVRAILTNDQLVQRYFKHVFEQGGDQEEKAVQMIVNSLKWRKESGIGYGKKLLVFDVKKHVKGKENTDDIRKFFLYQVERIEREENGDLLTLVFDCSGCGLKNMDLDFIQYMIGVLKDYTPWNLNYILVYDMPWVLNAAWKVIKSWLPASAVKKIKFLNKQNIGSDPWEYEFIPEPKREVKVSKGTTQLASSPADAPSAHEMAVCDEVPKSIRTDMKNSLSRESFISNNLPVRNDSINFRLSRENNNLGMLTINPLSEIVLKRNDQGDRNAQIHVTNTAGKPVVYKIKTTAPDKYRVRPSMGSLAPGASSVVEIYVPSALVGSPESLIRDKFLITAISVEDEHLAQSQIIEIVKTSQPEAQYRLRCTAPEAKVVLTTLNGGLPNVNATLVNGKSQPLVAPDVTKKVDNLIKKMTTISSTNEELKEQVEQLRKMILVILVLAVILIIALFWRTRHVGSNPCIPSNHDSSHPMFHGSSQANSEL